MASTTRQLAAFGSMFVLVASCGDSASVPTPSGGGGSDNAVAGSETGGRGGASGGTGAPSGGAGGSSAGTGTGGTADADGGHVTPDGGTPGDGGAPAFRPCVVDVSKVGATCGPGGTVACDGADIAMNYAKYPDPYACYVCAPGVTLLKGSACDTRNVNLVWNSTSEQCILNGAGYPMDRSHTCSSGVYADGVTANHYARLVSDWYRIATEKATANGDARVVSLKLEDKQTIQAAVAIGHGVLDGKCGSTFLVKVGAKYVLLLQVDVRSWSLELTPGANTWLDPSNVGGTCIIPEVRKIDAAFVTNQFL